MHFWIDKRSQTCGYSGRHRLPPSFIHTSCRQQRRQRRRSPRGGGKLMVTPVHRFQPIESTGLQSSASSGVNRRGVGVGGGGGGGGIHYQHHQPHQRQLHSYLAPTYVTNLVHARNNGGHSAELDSSVFLDLPLNGNGDHLQASASHRASTAPPDVVPASTLRCGIWAAFALATIFAAGLKFYVFDQKDKGSGIEVLCFFALFVVVLVGACTVTLRRSTTRSWDAAGEAPSVPPSQGPSGSSMGHDLVVVIEEPGTSSPGPPGPSQQPGTPGQTELPPPPYHIAILLPHQKLPPLDNDESPPPSYDKAVG